jgi:hypothetical protein
LRIFSNLLQLEGIGGGIMGTQCIGPIFGLKKGDVAPFIRIAKETVLILFTLAMKIGKKPRCIRITFI